MRKKGLGQADALMAFKTSIDNGNGIAKPPINQQSNLFLYEDMPFEQDQIGVFAMRQHLEKTCKCFKLTT